MRIRGNKKKLNPELIDIFVFERIEGAIEFPKAIKEKMKYAYCGDRQISVNILKFIISEGYQPALLIVSDKKSASHSNELIAISSLKREQIVYSSDLKSPEIIRKIKALDLDYIIGVHFPFIISNEILNLPKVGFLNLHPAYLPYNKGWHTPSWAILDETKYGATLHFMAEELDAGDIIHQKELKVEMSDTADSLYKKVLKLEEEVFKEAFEDLISLNPKRIKQELSGTSHLKKDLEDVREIKLDEKYTGSELINKLRSLTTNNMAEAAYFIKDGKKYLVQVKIEESDIE